MALSKIDVANMLTGTIPVDNSKSGSILQASTSFSSSLAARKIIKNISQDLRSDKYCQTVHSSELTEIFFETTEHMDCYYDPMSILR